MIVVGYVYNNNGMATWCVETAAALHEAGYRVLLVYSSTASLAKDLPFRTLKFDLPAIPVSTAKGIRRKSKTALSMLSGKSNGFSYLIYQYLLQEEIQPSCFFLNQSDMLDERVPVAQYLCAWVYPSGLLPYLESGYRASCKGSLKEMTLGVALSLSFYLKDYTAYKIATKVLALTPLMQEDLLKRKINVELISPCCEVKKDFLEKSIGLKANLLMAALDLDSTRKNIVWMLKVLNTVPVGQFTLTLIGKPGEQVNRLVKDSPHEIIVKGIVPREEALAEFAKADIFLFASIVDDWGYVIIEAMAKGLAILVPDKNPYNYIAGNSASLFELGDEQDFTKKLAKLLEPSSLKIMKRKNFERAKNLFSREAFAKAASSIL